MRIRTLIKVLLIITGGLCVLSTILQCPELEFYVKPTTIPLFFMLYWFNVKKLDILFLIILLLCFLGDVFLLISMENSFLFVVISYALCYLILCYYLIENYKSLYYNRLDIAYMAFFCVVWTYIAYEIYTATEGSMGDIKPYGIIYLIILYVLFNGAVFQYINIRSPKSLWFLGAVLNFVISDVCFALDRFYMPLLELKIINSIYQLLAVFFLIKFKTASSVPLKLKTL